MKKRLIKGVFALSLSSLVGTVALADAPILVTNTNDSGAGSLRAAVEQANAHNGGQIAVVAVGDIEIGDSLAYSGTGPLTILGNGQTIMTKQNVTLFAATQGADLTISNLSFEGPGGFDIENRGDLDGDAGKGIFVDVRDDQMGVVSLTLDKVTVSGVANHGVHVSDCSLADDCGGGSGGAGEGSLASIAVHLTDVTIEDAAYGKFDADGLRVDERSEGDIRFTAIRSTFARVGADGVELDEGQSGDVIARIADSMFVDNGGYCDPAIVGAFMPEVEEAEFEEGSVQEAAIPGAVSGTPDNTCIERAVDFYDDGSVEAYEFAIDLDDGIDIDEAGDGSLYSVMINTLIAGNLDEGVDYDEEGNGDIVAHYVNSRARNNTDDGFKHSEEDAGSVGGLMIDSSARYNGGKGVVFEEEGEGDLSVTASGLKTGNNDDSDGTGLELVQEDEGAGEATVTASELPDGTDLDGVELTLN